MENRLAAAAAWMTATLAFPLAWGDPPAASEGLAPAKPAASVAEPPAATSETLAAPAPRPLRHGVFRFNTYPAAWTAAQKTNRPILVYACSPSCPNCVRMLGETYRTPRVSRFVSDSFETVYVDRSEQPEMVAKLHLRWFPTTLVVSPNNKVIDVIEGYVDAETLERRLQITLASQQAETQAR